MKARGLILIDYDLPGGFIEAAEEEKRLQEALEELVKNAKEGRVVYYDCDLKERRGDGRPDLKKLKIRTS